MELEILKFPFILNQQLFRLIILVLFINFSSPFFDLALYPVPIILHIEGRILDEIPLSSSFGFKITELPDIYRFPHFVSEALPFPLICLALF